ncbi:hypothetical protein HAX54_044092 [Datura stramonium]|uniref:Uncharacterized protein n=1 Tax=Datura stramonium TaxID=4076 RepID=A0ABS8W683_DATST|nr:hypothetical protein [Datura stramonium]
MAVIAPPISTLVSMLEIKCDSTKTNTIVQKSLGSNLHSPGKEHSKKTAELLGPPQPDSVLGETLSSSINWQDCNSMLSLSGLECNIHARSTNSRIISTVPKFLQLPKHQ